MRSSSRLSDPPNTKNASKEAKVFVEKPEVLDDLINSYHDESPSRPSRSRLFDSQNSVYSVKSTDTHAKLLKERQQKLNAHTESILKQNVQKALEISYEKQERMFPVLLENVEKATKFLDTIDRDINLHDETQKNKVRRQFEDWNSTVHGTIQKNIAKTINTMDPKSLNKQKNRDYEQFLKITNRKPAIFRDIIIESEYDPLEPNRRCIKARTGFLKDPVKIDAQKAAAEGSMLGDNGGKAAKPQKLGKETLAVELWASGQIEATPYGTFARMMNKASASSSPSSGSGGSSDSQQKNATMRSNVVFDHFAYPKGKAALDPEMPRGKRIHPINVHANPAKTLGKLPDEAQRQLNDINPPENYYQS